MTEIIDSHLHLWDRDRFDYPWMQRLPSLPSVSLPEQQATTATGAIVIEAGTVPDQALAEVEWLSGLAEASPLIRGIVAAVDFTDPHLAEALDRLRARPLVVGVRDNFEGREAGDLAVGSSSTADALLAGALAALDAGLTVDLCVRAAQLDVLDGFVSALVDVRGTADGLVLDHLGKPLPDDPSFSRSDWVEAMTALAAHPGLHVKFSGLPGQIPGPVSAHRAYELAADYIGDVVSAFGPGRTMYGSDHPVSTTGHGLTAKAWADAVDTAVRTVLDDSDTAAVMGGTAANFYPTRRNGCP
ncbi:amidohydrolase family protein [Brevibacterium ammoniilyticum]|uniref:Amidohydrolase family protein n=1 Tax=Brevibacterium ammoniilyticum TaxID=1046555 RepID=A0ABP9TZC1_9MICO